MKDLRIRWRLHGDVSEPTTRQRGVFFIDELQSRGYDVGSWQLGQPADIIVLQYNMRQLDEALQTGAVVVADINDMVFAEHHVYHKDMMVGLKRVHAVVAGTERLAQHLRKWHRFVRVIEEPVDSRYLDVKKQKHDGINILWTGYHDNYTYFAECDAALEQLANKYQFTVNIVCPPLDGTKKSNADKVHAKKYPSRFHEWTMETLLQQMSVADFAVVPLFHNEWTACKASNKALSFMAAGIPVVASDVIPYRGIINHGTNGYLCTHTQDWVEALSSQLEDSRLRGRIGVAGKITAHQYTVDRKADDWLRLFEEIRPR